MLKIFRLVLTHDESNLVPNKGQLRVRSTLARQNGLPLGQG